MIKMPGGGARPSALLDLGAVVEAQPARLQLPRLQHRLERRDSRPAAAAAAQKLGSGGAVAARGPHVRRMGGGPARLVWEGRKQSHRREASSAERKRTARGEAAHPVARRMTSDTSLLKAVA